MFGSCMQLSSAEEIQKMHDCIVLHCIVYITPLWWNRKFPNPSRHATHNARTTEAIYPPEP